MGQTDRQTDRQTDGRTDGRTDVSQHCLMPPCVGGAMSRGSKMYLILVSQYNQAIGEASIHNFQNFLVGLVEISGHSNYG